MIIYNYTLQFAFCFTLFNLKFKLKLQAVTWNYRIRITQILFLYLYDYCTNLVYFKAVLCTSIFVPLGLKTVIVFEMSVSESEMLGTDS